MTPFSTFTPTVLSQPAQTKFKVLSLVFNESGTFNDVFLRPYETKTIDQNTINTLQERINYAGSTQFYTPDIYTGFANLENGIIGFSGTPIAKLEIPNGWGSQRLTFRLAVMDTRGNLSTKNIHLFQGYTDVTDQSLFGKADPNMVLYINSYMTITRNVVDGREVDRVTETAQLINSEWVVGNYGNQSHISRPCDVFAGIQSMHIVNMNQNYGAGNYQGHIDTRYQFGKDAKYNARNWLSPSNFLNNVITSQHEATNLVQYESTGGNRREPTSKAAQLAFNEISHSNPFLATMSNIKGSPRTISCFSLRDLQLIDPELPTPELRKATGMALAKQARRNNSESWNGADESTKIATYLLNTVTALAMSLSITKLHFTSHNHTVGAEVITTIYEDTYTVSTNSIVSLGQTFQSKFNNEIAKEISFNGQVPFSLEITMDIFGATRINLSYDGKPMTPYEDPTYADAMRSPVIQPFRNGFENIIHDMETLFSNIQPPTTVQKSVDLPLIDVGGQTYPIFNI